MQSHHLPKFKLRLWNILKFAVVIFCLVAFGGNSWRNFDQFLLGKTTLLAEVQSNEEILLPAFTFCNEEGFKDVTKMGNITELKTYLANTFSLEELFDAKGVSWRPINFSSFVTTYSAYRGRCFTYTHQDKMKILDALYLIPRNNLSLLIYAHDPGEEMWFNYFWLPEMLTMAKLEMGDFGLEIAVKKEIFSEGDECDWTMSHYTRCVAADFPKYYLEGKFPNCTTPWTQRMLGKLNYDDSNPCNLEQAMREQLAYGPYIGQAARFNHSTCQAPCERSTYKFTEERYNSKTVGLLWPKDDRGRLVRTISIYYLVVDVARYTNSLVVTFNTFVSNVGGSLGLFLGFSCISVIFLAIDKLAVICDGIKI